MRRIALTLLLVLAACTSSESPDEGLRLLHVTDPRLVGSGPDAAAATANREAFAAAVQQFQARPGQRPPPAILVVAGSLSTAELPPPPSVPAAAPPGTLAGSTVPAQGQAGQPAQPTPGGPAAPNPAGAARQPVGAQLELDTAQRVGPAAPLTLQADSLARALAAIPVSDIYLVPFPQDSALADSVRARSSAGGPRVHDLTSCYRRLGPRMACTAAVAGTSYMLVGFAPGSNDTVTVARLQRLDSLVDEWTTRGRHVIVVAAGSLRRVVRPATTGAADSATAAAAPPTLAERATTLWDSVTHDAVAVLGTEGIESAEPGRLAHTPALGSSIPLGSTSALRQAALVRITGRGPESNVLMYAAGFTAPRESERAPEGGGGFGGAVAWLWRLADADDLGRALIVALAFLAAYLTISALWRLQDSGDLGNTSTTVTTTTKNADGTSTTVVTNSGGTQANTTVTPAAGSQIPLLAFENNFARTVLSGLAGLLALSFLKVAWDDLFADATPFYLTWFVVLFVVLLVVYAVARAFTEALRSRLANPHTPPRWLQEAPMGPVAPASPPKSTSPSPGPSTGVPTKQPQTQTRAAKPGSGYKRRRAWAWVLSWRATLLVALDTLLGVLFGRNQLRSAVWELTIADLHWSLYRVMEDTRVGLANALASAAKDIKPPVPASGTTTAPAADDTTGSAVRASTTFHVSISAESDDGRSLYYITSDQGRSPLRFPVKSMAWVSVALGQPRWWLSSYEAHKAEIKVYEEKGGLLEGVLTVDPVLANLWQPRPGHDYQAFMVLPAPRRRPGGAPDAGRRGAIHISCNDEDVFKALWPNLQAKISSTTGGDPAVATADLESDKALKVAPAEVYKHADAWAYNVSNKALRQTLETAVATLGHALERFNESTFDTYILRCRKPERS